MPLLLGTLFIQLGDPASTRLDGRGDVHDPRGPTKGTCPDLGQADRVALITPGPLGDDGKTAYLIEHQVPDRVHG